MNWEIGLLPRPFDSRARLQQDRGDRRARAYQGTGITQSSRAREQRPMSSLTGNTNGMERTLRRLMCPLAAVDRHQQSHHLSRHFVGNFQTFPKCQSDQGLTALMVRSCACGENWLSLCIREIHRWFATSQESAGHVAAFSCSHPRHRPGNRRRMACWGPTASRRLRHLNCRYPNCFRPNRHSTPNCSLHCPSSCSSTHRCRCNTPGPECRSDLSRFRAFGQLPEMSPTTPQ
jgi:hypothetical protein